jgi:hypothetical protein
MATLYVTEFSDSEFSAKGVIPVVQTPQVAQQTLTISSQSSATTVFNQNTRIIRVHTDAVCFIAISSAPTATSTCMRMAADQTEYFGLRSQFGGVDKIAVCSTST